MNLRIVVRLFRLILNDDAANHRVSGVSQINDISCCTAVQVKAEVQMTHQMCKGKWTTRPRREPSHNTAAEAGRESPMPKVAQ